MCQNRNFSLKKNQRFSSSPAPLMRDRPILSSGKYVPSPGSNREKRLARVWKTDRGKDSNGRTAAKPRPALQSLRVEAFSFPFSCSCSFALLPEKIEIAEGKCVVDQRVLKSRT